ncbi:uncharacterized protein LY89DRAFT_508604 [Mollisia scopiformis]|uniref:Uncharacterized protein n=1 Tax=Mollisia scopiformis TaxID=149040 RepID=A0A194XFJ0_MOLSC|nr:uncharacterized protein LY89DRAFT_508604 [Mollisia scopiformis]KUJ18960.1 hypothetical protein LY89DRAFT_508604 [Mollisia scopiformis]
MFSFLFAGAVLLEHQVPGYQVLTFLVPECYSIGCLHDARSCFPHVINYIKDSTVISIISELRMTESPRYFDPIR